MKNEENKYYVLKVKYTVQEISGGKRKGKKSIQKRKKKYLVNNIESLDTKLKDIEYTLTEVEPSKSRNLFMIFKDYLVKFGSNCNSTYHRMLRI
ncbi:hypothetical protein INR76_04530 [Marixanthomonas sp. SCSIO 43207]|uniref:hypothetical protein n=1 Tax=Marixanthomonas sp. SCSIO 43207 TaxID=2779360 RepID=UPI001CA92F9C|nr:hypothetical protein [Marixanthomonas sp. SCSIO 43207]UAB82030.1 hypothetical protein INR76_04530 [Marixanthomonas sp. SCSIO 43207]